MNDEQKTVNQGADEKYNYLAAAEMGEEENYNMVDGVINNVRKPSLLEQMAEYERMIAEFADENDESKKKFKQEL